MTFATPLLAAIAAAVAIPALLLLYFLKLRRRDLEISSTLLWKKAIEDLQANAPFQRLRKNILLLLQLLALAAALLALAQPQRQHDAPAGARHVILIDRSASMNALDGSQPGETRLDEAKRRAIEQIDQFTAPGPFKRDDAADQAMLIAFDQSAEVLQRFTADKALLKQAVQSIQPTDVPGAIGEAFRLAQAHRPRSRIADDQGGTRETPTNVEIEGLVGGPPQTFHLFTDGRLLDIQQLTPRPDDSTIYHKAGSENAPNAAIISLRAERAYDNPERLSVFVALQNNSDKQWPVEVELLIDATPAAIRATTLPPASTEPGVTSPGQNTSPNQPRAANEPSPGTGGVVFQLERAERADITVRLRSDPAAADTPRDLLELDNVGRLIVPPAQRTTVALVSEGNLFLRDVLQSLPLARLEQFSKDAFDRLDDNERDAFDVVVLDGVLPNRVPAGRALPPGRWLVLGAIPTGPEALGPPQATEFARFLEWSRDHPVLRNLTLAAVEIGELKRVSLPQTSLATVIADTTAGPGIIEINAADYRAIVTTFDPAVSNWPLDVGFLVFLAYSIDQLGSAGQRAADADSRRLAPGSVLADRLPQNAANIRIEPPQGPSRQLVPAADGRVAFGPLKHTGIYTIRWSGDATNADQPGGPRATRRYAVNLLDPDESNTNALSSEQLRSRVFATNVAEANVTATQRYWKWLLLAALAIILLEWYVYNRKVML